MEEVDIMNKVEIRQHVWDQLEQQGEAAFPFPPTGRIPNFVGSSRAADRVNELSEWQEASVIKANPDSPQRYVRKLALEQGKLVYMAVPRLSEQKCFVEINVPKSKARNAASISGAFDLGNKVHPSDMKDIDLIVTGCVAVNLDGQRIGKGEGYSDLELAILDYYGKIASTKSILTTVHPIQIIEQQFPQESHDIVVEQIITEDEIIPTHNSTTIPELDWDRLTKSKLEAIPILQEIYFQLS